MQVLALNAGSSSLKFRFYRISAAGDESILLAAGIVDRIGTQQAELQFVQGVQEERSSVAAQSPSEAALRVLDRLLDKAADGNAYSLEPVGAIGYRIVHGGDRFIEATRITPEILADIRALGELAPLHNPMECDVIEAVLRRLPQAPAVAVFDTAFHRTLPSVASHYALPEDLSERYPLQRYGFHGISYRYVSEQLLKRLGRGPEGTRLILCHLGSGASVCALQDGRSVDTSMGFTPLEGLMMGTRCGDIDAGLLLYLLREKGMSPAALEDLLEHRSGLYGVSGGRSDLRDLEQASAAGDAKAALALDLFAYRVRKYLGAYAAAMGGLDAMAFTGGIGEHSAEMRSRICQGLAFLGVELNTENNRAARGDTAAIIGTEASRVSTWVIPTDEEQQIARETFQLLQSGVG